MPPSITADSIEPSHANTIYARFERIENLTGLDARRYRALDELLLAVDLART